MSGAVPPVPKVGWLKGGALRGVKVAKWGGIGALVGGAALALPFVVSGMRSNRRYNPDNEPPPPELTAPLPPVMEFPEPQQAQGQNTMMGMQPVEGEMARRVKLQRAGINAGVDPSAPSLMRPDGSNTIDGSGGIQDLNAPATRGM